MEPLRLVADMAADLFHKGHISFLKKARAYHKQNPIHLTVALHTDQQITSYKGKPPVMDYSCRKTLLESCRYVDQVIRAPDLFDETFLSRFDTLVHGDDIKDWDPKLVDHFYGAAMRLGKLTIVPYTDGISSTILKTGIKGDKDINI
jgi:cytidyltransferase-like protein